MRNFFIASDKTIKFNITKFKPLNFVEIRTSIWPDTLSKLAEGLNHFLAYYYHTNPQEYDRLCMHIWRIHSELLNEKATSFTSESMKDSVEPLIKKYCTLDDYLIERICEYVSNNVINNIDESASTTSVAANNVLAGILTCVVTAQKFSFIFSSIIKGGLKPDEIIFVYMDDLMIKVISTALSEGYFDDGLEYDLPLDTRISIIHNEIDNFLFAISKKLWEFQDSAFRMMFEEVGKDTVHYSEKHKATIISGFRKYVPQLVKELDGKYGGESGENVYYTIEKDYEDFKFANKNLTKYIHSTIRSIIKNQDSGEDLVPSNPMNFILDGTTETVDDVELMDSKMRFRADSRKLKSIELIDDITKEIGRRFGSVKFDYVGEFNLSPDHLFNQMILQRSLLALTGESKMYSLQLGAYAKLLLLLFYASVKSHKGLEKFHYDIDVMRLEPKGDSIVDVEVVAEMLKERPELMEEATPEAVRACIRLYSNRSGHQRILELDRFLDFLDFVRSPARIRHLLFPDKYSFVDNDDTKLTIKPILSNAINTLKQIRSNPQEAREKNLSDDVEEIGL